MGWQGEVWFLIEYFSIIFSLCGVLVDACSSSCLTMIDRCDYWTDRYVPGSCKVQHQIIVSVFIRAEIGFGERKYEYEQKYNWKGAWIWFSFYHLHGELMHLNVVRTKISLIVFGRTSNSSHTLSSCQTMEPCTSDEFFQALNHAEQTFKKMENYLRHKQLCDVVLVAGDRRIPAHR